MAANLFHHGVDTVAVFHIVIVWRLVRSKTFAVKQESNRVHLQTSSLAKRLENLLELGGRAHFEVHLSVFLRRVSRQSLYPPWKIFLLSLYNAHIPRVPVATTSRVNASRKKTPIVTQIHPSIHSRVDVDVNVSSFGYDLKKIKDDWISFDSIHHASSRDPTHRIPNLDVQVVLRLDFLLDVFIAPFLVAVHPSCGVRSLASFASLRCDCCVRKTREKNLSVGRMCKQYVYVHWLQSQSPDVRPVGRRRHARARSGGFVSFLRATGRSRADLSIRSFVRSFD